jgi:hypothetical protein
MPAMAIIPAIIGSAFYGVLVGIGWYLIYVLRGAPGATGMEIMIVPFLTVVAVTAGTAAAVISLVLPRTSLRWSDSFVLLVLAALALQTLASLAAFQILQNRPHDMLLHAMTLSAPVEWRTGTANWNWLYTLPLTVGICSPWFRTRFDG